MDNENWVQIVLGLLGIGLSITLTLIGILFSWLKGRQDRNEERTEREISELRAQINERLRTLGHEDRDIRGQLNGLKDMLLMWTKDKK